jgi:membrane associated rhomboid family serine protease
VIDLNHILLFLAFVSPLAVLARSWRPDTDYHGWRLAAVIVLAVTGAAWLFFREEAGYIGGGAWIALLFLPAVALKRMSELAARGNFKGARRLAIASYWLHPTADLRHQIQLLRQLERDQAAGRLPPFPVWNGHSVREKQHWLKAPAVAVLILLNTLVFAVELYASSGMNEAVVLHRLGALEPDAVFWQHQYWRLFASLFLHAGSVHLLFNLFALYIMGPPLERAIGTTRFFVCYLVSGLCSSAGVVALWRLGITNPGEVVGASGCVMGVVGAMAGFLLRHRHMPLARRRLTNIIMIVVIQTAFDLTTPQVSMSAHLCGLVAGFVVGLLISPSRSNQIGQAATARARNLGAMGRALPVTKEGSRR